MAEAEAAQERRPERISVRRIRQSKEKGEKIVMITAYDAVQGRLADRAEVDIVLVGDSMGNVILGHENTLPVDLEATVHHSAAVRRGVERSLVIADLPFMSYERGADQALESAGRLLKASGVNGVKLEGGSPLHTETVRRLTEAGIPVMGHLGLTPQSVHMLGHRVQGRSEPEAREILRQAEALNEAGAFSLVLEAIPASLAARITGRIEIPTIGIGAGPDCDGQVLVYHDLLDMEGMKTKFVRQYAHIGEAIVDAIGSYAVDVRRGNFPGEKESYE